MTEPRKLTIFQQGDSANWFVSDFYRDQKLALKDAIASGEDFTTGWWSCKRANCSGQISVKSGKAEVNVSCRRNDELTDSIDVAIREIYGWNGCIHSGCEVLADRYPGITEKQINSAIDAIAEYARHNLGFHNETQTGCGKCQATYNEIVKTLDSLARIQYTVLETQHDSLVELIRNRLDEFVHDACRVRRGHRAAVLDGMEL